MLPHKQCRDKSVSDITSTGATLNSQVFVAVVKGLLATWDPKLVAAGRVGGVAAGEG